MPDLLNNENEKEENELEKLKNDKSDKSNSDTENSKAELLDESSNDKNKSNKKSITYEILTFVRDLAIILFVFWLITTFIGEKTNVVGDSMEPHIHNGDIFILNKLTYRFSEPKKFDIIVFPYNNGESNYIKRIIGLPGEVIDFKDGKIVINGKVLDESYGKEPIRVLGNQKFPLVIPEDEYFVMGDNRNDSSDSRYQDVGTIPRDKILGKIWVRIWPLNSFGTVQ